MRSAWKVRSSFVVLALGAAALVAACSPGAPPPVFAAPPVSGTSQLGGGPPFSSQPAHMVDIVAFLSEGDVITASVEQLDLSPGRSDLYGLAVRECGTPSAPVITDQYVNFDTDAAGQGTATLEPVDGTACAVITVINEPFGAATSAPFNYTVSW